MREIAHDLTRWLAAGEPVVLATVIAAHGPSLRTAGAQMAISAAGELCGSVSAGCVEGAIFEEAQAVLTGGLPRRLRYGVTDERAWEVGLAWGGTIEVYLEPFEPVHRAVLRVAVDAERIVLATRLGGPGHLLAWPNGSRAGDSTLEAAIPPMPRWSRTLPAIRECEDSEVFVQQFEPPPTLIIVGAVHIAIPLVTLAQAIGYRVRVVDPRRTFAARERFPTADDLVTRWPQDALQAEELGPQCAVVILSHDPKFDLPALRIALRSQAAYVCLLGSGTTQAKRCHALFREGFTEAELVRIHGPVGLDLGGRSPAEIALAVIAEIVARDTVGLPRIALRRSTEPEAALCRCVPGGAPSQERAPFLAGKVPHQIVLKRTSYAHGHNLAHRQLGLHEHESIDLRRVTIGAANAQPLALALNQHVERLANECLVFGKRDRLLQRHEFVAARFLEPIRYIVG